VPAGTLGKVMGCAAMNSLHALADYFSRGGTRKEIAGLITRMDQEKSKS
jgi:hypothetical protein